MDKNTYIVLVVLVVAVVGLFVLFSKSFSLSSGNLAGQAVGVSRCTDSDGGLNYVKQGTLSGPSVSAPQTDQCTSATKLKEFYCGSRTARNAVASRMYNCAALKKVCMNGACV